MIVKGGMNKAFPQAEEGPHHGICVSVWDLGTQHNDRFDKDERKLCLTFEFVDDIITKTDSEGNEHKARRLMSTSDFTAMLTPRAKLRKTLERWRNKPFTEKELEGFDMDSILGVNAILMIREKENGYSVIDDILPFKGKIPEGFGWKNELPDQSPFSYDIDRDGQNIPDVCPMFMKKKIANSMEWKKKGWTIDEEGGGRGQRDTGPVENDAPPHEDSEEPPPF